MAIVQSYGAIKPQPSATMRRNRLAFMGISALALAAVIAVVVISAPVQPQAEMLEDFPQTDLDLLNVMQQMAQKEQPAPQKTMAMAQASAPVHDISSGLSMKEQYARIMQNMGYFAPWSRQNSWADRVAIDNIRKANTPQALAMRQQQIRVENAKFAKKFSTPHTSQYTGKHESLASILDPRYQPWGNDGPRKAYYDGY